MQVTEEGKKIVRAITAARRRVLAAALADWSEPDRLALVTLNRRFADILSAVARERS